MQPNILSCPNILSRLQYHSAAISDDSINELLQKFTPVSFSKSQPIIEEGNKCGYAFFIEKGLTRSFWMVDGEEITTSFSTEGSIVFSMDEVYYGLPSEEYIEALEPVEAFSIPVSDLRHLTQNNLELARWWSHIHQDEYRRIHRSHKERLSLSAANRYEAFCKQFPDICRRVKRSYIASYLGITLSPLSRLRPVS